MPSRRRHPRLIPIALLCLALAALAGGAGTAAVADDAGTGPVAGDAASPPVAASGASIAGASAGRPKLKKCSIGTTRPVRCGHIMVPMVRGVPKLGKEKIGFAVRPRGDRSSPSKGTFVFVEGGPGFAATNFDSARPFLAVFKPFLKHHDVVFMDQRGTGHSNPVKCKGLQRGTQPFRKAVESCFRQLGPRARGLTTANSAADIQALIERMNLKHVILYGDSYGTYLGQSYAARYGRNIDGLILSSAYPAHAHSGNNGLFLTLYPAAINAMRLACKRAQDCSGDAVGRYKRVIHRMGSGTKKADNVLEYLMEAGSYSPNSYRNLNTAISQYLRGQRRPLAELAPAPARNQGPAHYFSVGMYEAVICNDYPNPWDRSLGYQGRKRQFDRVINDFRPNDRFSPFTKKQWFYSPASDIANCLAWPRHKYTTPPAIPPGAKMPAGLKTLVVAGEFDDITSEREARQVTAEFPRGRLYVARNRGHASDLYYPFTSKVTPRIRHFVANLHK